MNLPQLKDIDLNQKRVLVRADLDLSEGQDDTYRLEAIIPTLRFLFEKNCEIVLIGHRGRPKGKEDSSLSLKPISKILENLLKSKWGEKDVSSLKMEMMENLRFNPGEEENDEHYATHLSENGQVFINEAFAASHRRHASIVALPKIIPHAAGFRFNDEIDHLSKARQESQKPVLIIVGGVKEGKTNYLTELTSLADKILVAGRLPDYIPETSQLRVDERFVVAKLLPDKEDITIHSIEAYEEEIKKAKTIIVAGPIGKFEEEGHMMGTKRIFEAVSRSSAEKIAAGGDTVRAIKKLELEGSFSWISVGGGAALEYLTKGTLPGIEALLN